MWQPIETAPKDGTCILVFPAIFSGQTVAIASWDRDEHSRKPRPFWRHDSFAGVSMSRANQPTHWMSMPEPPTITDHV